VIAGPLDTGMMGGKLAHEYMYLTPVGEDTLILCDQCGLAANRQVAAYGARSRPTACPAGRKSSHPGLQDHRRAGALPPPARSKTAKAGFSWWQIGPKVPEKTVEQFVFAVVRGDMELNETKLANAVGARSLRPATEDEIRAVGAVPGYASPVGLNNVLVVVDDLVPARPTWYLGPMRLVTTC
jgi:prolyl-tRNA synthetase